MLKINLLSLCLIGLTATSAYAKQDESIVNLVSCSGKSGADSVIVHASVASDESGQTFGSLTRLVLRGGKIISAKAYGNRKGLDQFASAGNFSLNGVTGNGDQGGLMRYGNAQPENESAAATFSGETEDGMIKLTGLEIAGKKQDVSSFSCAAFRYE